MTLPLSGTISLNQIEAEWTRIFGPPSGSFNMNAYAGVHYFVASPFGSGAAEGNFPTSSLNMQGFYGKSPISSDFP